MSVFEKHVGFVFFFRDSCHEEALYRGGKGGGGEAATDYLLALAV